MKSILGIGSLLFVLGGCSFLGDASMGDEGEVQFRLYGVGCGFGCDLSEPVAVGSQSDIGLNSELLDEALSVRVPDSVIASYRESFTCFPASEESPNEVRSVAADEPCAAGEKRTAAREMAVTPSRAEPFVVEVLRAGEVFDRITVDARAVAGFVTFDDALDEEVEAISIAPGESRSLRMKIVDEDGDRLAFSHFGGRWAVDDESIAVMDDDDLNEHLMVMTGVEIGRTTLRLLRNDDTEIASIDVEVKEP